MDESDYLYIAEKIGIVAPVMIDGRPLYLISPQALVEDLIVFADTVLYEYEEMKVISDMMNRYEIGDVNDFE